MQWEREDIANQAGRVFLITGANSGLGFETTKALLEKDATVIMACRSINKAKVAKEKLLKATKYGKIRILELDLADLNDVNNASSEIGSQVGHIDVLINNAGIMAPPRSLSKQNFELQFAVNHLAHMALTIKLLPLMSAQYLGEICWADLQGQYQYDRWKSYSQSKLANAMFALELEDHLRITGSKTSSLLAHPGLARTNLQSTSISATGKWQEAYAYKLMGPLFQSARMGALPQILAATNPEAKGGQQYGPRFNFRGAPKLVKIAPIALNKGNRVRLWEESKKLFETIIN